MPPTPRSRTRASALFAIGLMAATISLTACGTTDTPTQVASLDAASGKDKTTTTKKEATDAERKDAMLEFAACMRKNGIDMPDPKISSDGKGMVAIQSSRPAAATGAAGADGPSKAEQKKMEAANKECEPIMEAVAGGGEEMSPEDQAKFRDEQLKYAKCMRDNGVDMPDPEITFDGGKTQIKMGGGTSDAGQRIDPNSDTFDKATEACKSLLGDGQMGISAAPVGGGGMAISSDTGSESTGAGK